MIRTFIAIEIPDAVRTKIAEFLEDLKKEPAKVSWVKPDNIHITLKFLGNVEEGKIDQIEDAVKRATVGVSNFKVMVRGTGAFPNYKRPRVLWIGGEEKEGKLQQVQQKIEAELSQLGFPKEQRAFSTHLTLGRVKSIRGIESVIEKMNRTNFVGGEFEVSEIVVMRSDLKPTGAVYTPLKKIKLGEIYGR